MDPASRASDSGPQAVKSENDSASPHNEEARTLEARTRDEVENTDAETNIIPDHREDAMDEDPPEDPPDDPPQSEDTATPVDLTGALEKQAQRGDTNSLPQPHSAPDDITDSEPRPPGGSPSDSLFDNPPNLSKIRRLLFECNDPIEITQEEFDIYWPFIDNVWVKQRSNASKEGLCTTDYYMCRLRRPTHRPSETRPPLPEGKRPRKKRSREGGTCNFQIKVIRFEGAYSAVTISKTPGSDTAHTHDLDHSDRVKRNSGVMEFVRKESVKGYLPSSIYAKFREEPAKLQEAGGRSLTVTDVRNVAAKWRIQNPEVQLVPHEGYEYQKGQGIIKSGTSNGTNGNSQLQPQSLSALSESSPQLPPDTLAFPQFSLEFLEPYLPTLPTHHSEKCEFPHVTLSYASSMDSKISLRAGMQTVLSGPEAKVMTHYLRSRHDAILIGVGTVLADNPGLNCRLEGAGGFGGLGRMWQPRPVVLDPTGRWAIRPDDRMLRTAVEGKGRAPWVVVSPGAPINPDRLMMLKGYGGDFLRIMEYNRNWRLRWEAILRTLASEGIKSVMIEGGGTVLNELLNPEYTNFIDSIVVTVAPTYLGHGGVGVSPESKLDTHGNPNAALNPRDVKWTPLGQNVIMCGKIRQPGTRPRVFL
ncbi:Bacterial bifunctional deaminase-reductase C-terminal [Penicillium verhagenii]|uniref:Bacterial bifunctional deaminase-reductase C-terminal n=1 Tax=Penicillium verhagenii TaxID=1562060 RepID=UPI0025454734|nr:Bacterial bifunctional deaminase-reductase C-terminal [Penicillium verhagenii]KAJ5935673.1 Bacterial bifunctional deaminase-reductase C-terminal [Penicillium verhagenii]